MPKPKEKTIVITLAFQEAVVAWCALNAVCQDLENTSPFRIRAAELSQKLLDQIMGCWPHMGSDDIVDLFQHLKHHQVPG